MNINKKDIKQSIIYYIVMILIFLLSDSKEAFFDYIIGCTLIYIVYFIYKKRGEIPEIAMKRYQRKEAYRKKTTILHTSLIKNSVTYKETGVISGAIVGGVLLGKIGAFLGALMNYKRKIDKVSFRVTYLDYHSEIKSVKYNSRKYKKYMKYLKSH